MDVYTTPFHTAVGVAEVEQYLRQALGGAMNAYGTIHRGALAARVWPRGALSDDDWDEALGRPATGEVTWFVERGAGEALYEQALELMGDVVPRFAVDLDATVLHLWERDSVLMSRLDGEIVGRP